MGLGRCMISKVPYKSLDLFIFEKWRRRRRCLYAYNFGALREECLLLHLRWLWPVQVVWFLPILPKEPASSGAASLCCGGGRWLTSSAEPETQPQVPGKVRRGASLWVKGRVSKEAERAGVHSLIHGPRRDVWASHLHYSQSHSWPLGSNTQWTLLKINIQ